MSFQNSMRVAAAAATLLAGVSAHAWTISLNFDNQSVDEDCDALGSGRSYVSSDVAASPPNACTFWIEEGETGWGTWGGTLKFPHPVADGGEIWIRTRVYMPEEFDYTSPGEGKRLKFFRFRTYDASGEYVGYDNLHLNPPGSKHPFDFIYSGVNEWQAFGTPQDAMQKGKWETLEFYVRFDDKKEMGENGAVYRVWKNGELLKESFSRRTLTEDGGYAKYFYFGTYWNGGSPKSQHMYIDDLVLTTDKPSNVDAQANAFIGVGTYAPPMPPTLSARN